MTKRKLCHKLNLMKTGVQLIVAIALILTSQSCNKKDSGSTTIPTPVDYTTKYTSSTPVSISRPLIISGLHAETIKLVKLNSKYQLITSYADLFGTTYDFFRCFEIDSVSGKATENTLNLLGEYKEVGFPKSPFFYTDLNGDGIRDLFEVDHGKETPSLMVNGQYPGFENHLFLGTADGRFIKTSVPDLTNVKRFHHNAAVGDLDNDGDNDLVLQYFGNDEMYFFKNSNGLQRDRILNPGNSTGAVLIQDVDGDGIKDIISAPYIDRGANPSTRILKLNLTSNSFTTTPLSSLNPFGAGYGCFKLLSIPNPNAQAKNNIIFFAEGGIGDQRVFRTTDQSLSTLEEIFTKQSTFKSNNIRDFEIADLNMDGYSDIFFMTNPGTDNLNQRVWINKGDNTFENPNWEIDVSLKDHFSILSIDKAAGRTKFLYFSNTPSPETKMISIYTKKR